MTLYGDDPERKRMAQYVLWYTLDHLLRLLHPFMPFITEEIWQALPKKENTGDRSQETATIMLAEYPAIVSVPVFSRGCRRYGKGHGGYQRYPQYQG